MGSNRENKKKVRISNRIFFKVYINFAIMLTLSAILVGLIFMNLYTNTSMDNYQSRLRVQATRISEELSSMIGNKETENFLEYLDVLQKMDTDKPDIWTISNPDAIHPMDKSVESASLDDIILPDDSIQIIKKAFAGYAEHRSGYYEEFGGMSAIVGVPVRVKDEVVGVVMLVSEIREQEKLIQDSMSMIYLSVGVSLFISFIIAIVFAKGISNPISLMRATALKLADGNYESRTAIKRQDEIGDLARTIDILAEELKENESERLNREQARVDFFANVSHELRTPITVIRAYTESLLDGIITDEEKIFQYYVKILSECKGMERLVGDLLLLSKMQNPDFEIDKEPVDILQIIDDLVKSVHAISEEKNIRVELTKDKPVYMMMGDYDRLKQMFLIILDNAIKFSQENSSIHIILAKQDKLMISIRDEGIGIAKEDLPSIFDKFYKSKLKQNEQGSGLGLAIARQIALKHQGEIKVNSVLGKGTEFTFYFQCLENYVEKLNI